jgi:GPH family glycoside/pentoside/hexuronide:cation symporter
VTWSRRLLFFAGQLGVMALVRFFFSWSLKYSDQEHDGTGELLFTASMVGLALLVARLLDGGVDPVIGRIADRWVASGRDRRSFLLFAFALPPVGLALSFYGGFEHSPTVRWICLSVGMLLLFTGYSLYTIPYWSLIDDYAGKDARERGLLSNLLGAGLLASVAAVNVVSPSLIGDRGYRSAAFIFASIAIGLMILPWFAKPRTGAGAGAGAGAGTGTGAAAGTVPSLGQQLIAIFKHRRFMAMLVLFCGSQMALSAITAAAPFIVERLLGGTDRDVAKVMTPFLGTAIPFFALSPWISRRIGWERAMLLASVWLVLVYVGTGFLGEGLIGSPMTTAMIVFGLGGPMVAVLLGVEAEAITDCSRETGGTATGLYFGVANFMIQALNGVATFVTGLLVTASRAPGREELMTRMMSVVAGIMLVVGIVLFLIIRPRGQRPHVVQSQRVA